MGTVIEFNDGKARKVLILDAVYRAPQVLQFGTYDTDSSLKNYDHDLIYLSQAVLGTDTKDFLPNKAKTITDAWINTNVVKDNNTAKQNCDVWMTYKGQNLGMSGFASSFVVGVPSVEYCRSIKVTGTPCDLPNIQTLVRIYCDAEAIDSMDPTVSANSTRALGSRNSQGAWYIGEPNGSDTNYYSWSSTEYNKCLMWRVMRGGHVGVNAYQTAYHSVIPILEL